VVIRQHEAVSRDERAGAAVVEAHARQPQVLEPRRRYAEPVLLLDGFRWGMVERPHPLVGASDRCGKNDGDEKKVRALHSVTSVPGSWITSVRRLNTINMT